MWNVSSPVQNQAPEPAIVHLWDVRSSSISVRLPLRKTVPASKGQKDKGGLMESYVRPLRDRLRRRLAYIADGCGKLLAILIPRARQGRAQRICPFCGLITPRSKSSCLECGKSFKLA